MFPRMLLIVTTLLLVLPIVTFSGQGRSGELPEGVNVTVIAEYASAVPSLEMVRLVKVVLAPGAGWKDLTQKTEEYCQLATGTLTATDLTLGTTQVLSAGSWWPLIKGHRYTTFNTGNVDTEMWVYQLIEKGEADDQKM